MKSVTAKGKTVDEAITNALEELGATADQVTTKVLEVPGSGFMGVIGGKYAKVEVTLNDDANTLSTKFLTDLLDAMDIKTNISTRYEDDILMIDLNTEETGVLIGRRGQTLDAIQYLCSLVINKDNKEYTRVSIDVEGYREKRKNALQDLADRIAQKVEKTRKQYALEPMNPYERRIIHSALQNYRHVETHSEGEEPNRHIIIQYKP